MHSYNKIDCANNYNNSVINNLKYLKIKKHKREDDKPLNNGLYANNSNQMGSGVPIVRRQNYKPHPHHLNNIYNVQNYNNSNSDVYNNFNNSLEVCYKNYAPSNAGHFVNNVASNPNQCFDVIKKTSENGGYLNTQIKTAISQRLTKKENENSDNKISSYYSDKATVRQQSYKPEPHVTKPPIATTPTNNKTSTKLSADCQINSLRSPSKPKSDTSAESSLDSSGEDGGDSVHVLEPSNAGCGANGPRKCLTWACKACKKKTVTIDRRKAATLRERRRLRKVKIFQTYSNYNIKRF